MSGVQIVRVKNSDDGIRLNRWFLKYYPGLSLGRFQKLLRTKQIKVNGQKAEANTRLQENDEIRVPPLDNEKKVNETTVSFSDKKFIENLVIYKDEKIIVLNKPSGLAVQGGTNTSRHIDGMLDALKFGKDEKPKLVHRIDKDTSGILVLARDRKMADVLTKAFREHNLGKTYLALTRGWCDKEFGEIKAPLEKIDGRVQVSEGGKNAVTEYEIIDNVGNKFSLVLACPLTGRTHQIRAHMEYMDMPILGDDKYFGNERIKDAMFQKKLHLHAYKIDLSYIYGKKMVVKAKLPDYFIESIKTLGLNFKE
ncbi:MAG: RluA family pseudouridine synthase [Alphaproteobacteria bacterium]|nr:RluA family pseudouridine synthase [Alphaproteobacteria bacterium]